MRILVVGAGIGGLAAALALRQQGFDVQVYEQASVLREVGAGLAISPNDVKVLHWLGLAVSLRSAGVVPLSMDPLPPQTPGMQRASLRNCCMYDGVDVGNDAIRHRARAV